MQRPLSPDGNYWWDGTRWLPVATAPAASSAPARTSISWSALGGGIAVIVSAVALAIACFLPYGYYTNPEPSSFTQSSILNQGYATGVWYAIEPVLVVVLALVGGIVMMVWPNRNARIALAAALAVIGLQTFALFIGYTGGSNVPGFETIGPAGWVGMAGGILLMTGAIVAGLGAFQRKSA